MEIDFKIVLEMYSHKIQFSENIWHLERKRNLF